MDLWDIISVKRRLKVYIHRNGGKTFELYVISL